MQTVHIKVNGMIEDLKPLKGETFKLAQLQEIVNGQVELVSLSKRKVYMIINEEGKLLNLPVNDVATALWEEEYGSETGDYIVGDVALIQFSEFV